MSTANKKINRKGKTAIIVVSILAALVIIGVIAFNLIFKHFYDRMNHETLDMSNTNYQSDPIIEETEDPDDTIFTDYGDDDPTARPTESSTPSDSTTSPSESTADVTTSIIDITTAEEFTVEITDDIGEIPTGKDFMNILIIGTDAVKAGTNGRSDAIILVSVNAAKKRIVMTSIVRDAYVHIPYNNAANEYPDGLYDKISASHSLGGTVLLIKTIEENFPGIKIDRYVRAKYADFVKVYEYVGGLDIALSRKEIEYINDGLINDPNLQDIYTACAAEGFKLTKTGSIPVSMAGQKVHLNADALFIYSRARKIVYDKNDPNCAGTEVEKSADWGRTERQRLVLSRTFDKVKGMNILQLLSLVDNCLPLITTDLSFDECRYFVNHAVSYFTYQIEMYNLPFNNSKYFEYRYVKNGVLQPAGATSGTSIIYIKPENRDTMLQTWLNLIYN